MPTPRHLINRHRRLAASAPPASAPRTDRAAPARPAAADGAADRTARPGASRSRRERTPSLTGRGRGLARRTRIPAVAVLLAAALLLGGFAVFAGVRTAGLRDQPALRNAALADVARTSEVKGRVARAVEEVFRYDFADPGALDRAAGRHLTGRAVADHRALLAAVRKEGPGQKLVLTTTVTHSGVELIDGDRARVLVFADQTSTRTAAKDRTTHAAAMLAVDAVRRGGGWRIAAVDTLGAGS